MRMGNSPQSTNIYDSVAKIVPMCSVYHAPSYEPNLSLLTQFSTELAYLSLLFILELACTTGVHASSKINNMLREANFSRNQNSKLRIGSYNGAWCAEHIGAAFTTISQILMEWSKFFIFCDFIWQTLVRVISISGCCSILCFELVGHVVSSLLQVIYQWHSNWLIPFRLLCSASQFTNPIDHVATSINTPNTTC